MIDIPASGPEELPSRRGKANWQKVRERARLHPGMWVVAHTRARHHDVLTVRRRQINALNDPDGEYIAAVRKNVLYIQFVPYTDEQLYQKLKEGE